MLDLLALVLAGHFLGDYIFQTDYQALNKEHNWKADLQHAASYTLAFALLLLPFWHTLAAFAFLGITFASHAFIDRRWPTRWMMEHTHAGGFATLQWGVIVNDQALHFIIALVAYFFLYVL